MNETEKLRSRLKNIQRNSTEYKMTVKEAQSLLSEIDSLLIPPKVSITEISTPITTTLRILDGGTF